MEEHIVLQQLENVQMLPDGGQNSPVRHSKDYMDINEFMDVLGEIELITPFGRLSANDSKAKRSSLEEGSRFHSHTAKAQTFKQTKTAKTTNARLTDVRDSMWKQELNESIVKDAVLTSYLLLLLSNTDDQS